MGYSRPFRETVRNITVIWRGKELILEVYAGERVKEALRRVVDTFGEDDYEVQKFRVVTQYYAKSERRKVHAK